MRCTRGAPVLDLRKIFSIPSDVSARKLGNFNDCLNPAISQPRNGELICGFGGGWG